MTTDWLGRSRVGPDSTDSREERRNKEHCCDVFLPLLDVLSFQCVACHDMLVVPLFMTRGLKLWQRIISVVDLLCCLSIRAQHGVDRADSSTKQQASAAHAAKLCVRDRYAYRHIFFRPPSQGAAGSSPLVRIRCCHQVPHRYGNNQKNHSFRDFVHTAAPSIR